MFLIVTPTAADETLRQAYSACERHILYSCGGVIPGTTFPATCNSICASRPGGAVCGGAYEWKECDKIAERWLIDPQRELLLEQGAEALKDQDRADKLVVQKAVQ
jgi:hypothetical protein